MTTRGCLPSRCVGINSDTTTPRQRRVIHRCAQITTDRYNQAAEITEGGGGGAGDRG